MITSKIMEFIDRQKLGYIATVTPDGLPNISPKGTIIGWSTTMLAFADIRSPDTVKNLQINPHVQINIVDPVLRRGYLFEGKAEIATDNETRTKILEHYKKIGIKSEIRAIILVKVSSVTEVTSPLYDLGITEQEIKSKWKKYFENL